MKKKIILSISLILISISLIAQTFEMRCYLNDYDYIAVQLRQTALGGQPDCCGPADGLTNLVFQVRWLQDMGSGIVDVDVDIICTDYNITESGTRTAKDSYYYQDFSCSLPLLFPSQYALNEWETITTLQATLATGTESGAFDIAPNNWGGALVLSIDWDNLGSSTQYNPTEVTGACNNTPIPTLVYDLVWTGADATYPTFWDYAPNWEAVCGGAGAIPNTGDNCIIPVVTSGIYPVDIYSTSGMGIHQPICDNLRINSGASLSIDNEDASSNQVLFTVNNNLAIYGQITIVPNGQLTVSGTSYLDAAECLVVESTSAGTGSFINNGTITYGGSGTAKVQTYLTNAAGVGNFYIHQVGPTVDEANYTGGGTGAYLSAFILDGQSTYAYEWDETQNIANGWQNISSLTYEVRTADGIGLSTIDNTNHTLEMTGALITGNVSSPALTYSNNHYELISNPYPSSIDFDGLAGDNSTVVQNKYWIWDPAGPNYVARAAGAGGSQYIQVGQGFFVETKQAGTFDFMNARRSHSNAPFRNVTANILTVRTVGGMEGYKDELIIRFDDDATSGYDIEIEAVKWNSMYDDATMIRSIAEDDTELAINVLPLESLNGGMVSVPVHFQCGYNSEYTLSFFDMETFDYGTEIWLEDKQVGGDWISINYNPDYYFTATPQDPVDRFVIHFFGPTGIDELNNNAIKIYSDRNYAYIINKGNEHIKEIQVYDLLGNLIIHKTTPDNSFNKLYVNDVKAYYLVKVITDKHIYTEKVFITR